ncbi:uncharacterized protein LOC144422089 [Styela clava]
MSDSEQLKHTLSSIDQQTIESESIDKQADKSDLYNPKTIEADPSVQQIVESDILDHDSSNDTGASGGKSPRQIPQQQHEHIFQDLDHEDNLNDQQGTGHEYQVKDTDEGGHKVVPQPKTGNTLIQVVRHIRNLHYHVAPVYQGSVFRGDVVGSKVEARESSIGTIGSPPLPDLDGPREQAALTWLDEEYSGSSQEPGLGGLEGRPAFPWHGEEQDRKALHLDRSLVDNEVLQMPAPKSQQSSTGNEQLEENVSTLPTIEQEELVSMESKNKTTRHDRSWMTQTESPTTESESQTNLISRRDRMNQTDKKQMDDTESQTDRRHTRDRRLQTDNYKLDMDTQTRPNIARHISEQALASTEMNVETDPKQALDNDIQTTILQQANTPTQTLVKTNQENEFQTNQKKAIDTFTQENGKSNEASADLSIEYEASSLQMIEMYKREASTLTIARKLKPLQTVIAIVWGVICCKITSSIVKKNCDYYTANIYPILLGQYFNICDEDKRLEQFVGKLKQLAELARQFKKEGKIVHAVAAYYALAKLNKFENKTPGSMQGILSSIEQISSIMEKMIKQKQTKASSHVMSLMREMTDFLGLVRRSDYSQFINEIKSKATKFDSEENFIPAVVSLYVAAKLHELNNTGEESMMEIKQSVEKIRYIVEKILKNTKQHSMKKIFKEHVIPLMHEMLKFMQSIPGSSKEVRVIHEAWCLVNIGLCYHYCDENQEYANINESAFNLMKTVLGKGAHAYRLYGLCINYAGHAHNEMGNREKAVEFYEMSLEAFKNATDSPSDDEDDDNEYFKRAASYLEGNKSKLPE